MKLPGVNIVGILSGLGMEWPFYTTTVVSVRHGILPAYAFSMEGGEDLPTIEEISGMIKDMYEGLTLKEYLVAL